MNEAWNKAMKELEKIAKGKWALLKCEQWINNDPYGLRFSAYITDVGHSEWLSTPGAAVRDLKNKMKII